LSQRRDEKSIDGGGQKHRGGKKRAVRSNAENAHSDRSIVVVQTTAKVTARRAKIRLTVFNLEVTAVGIED
jgi:hypothetical protein